MCVTRTRANCNSHLSSCKRLMSAARTDRHNRITTRIKEAVDLLNICIRTETRHCQEDQGRTDAEIFFPNTKNVELDVTIIGTDGKKIISATACKGAPTCRHTTLDCGSDERALRMAERRKDIKHKALVEAAGKTFYPFVMTYYGSFGKACSKVLGQLAGRAAKLYPTQWETPGDWALHFKTTLAFQLHRGNSTMWTTAIYNLQKNAKRHKPSRRERRQAASLERGFQRWNGQEG